MNNAPFFPLSTYVDLFYLFCVSFFFWACGRIGFVSQDDVLFPQLTVEETLIYAAFLKLPSSMSRGQKCERVETIVKELGLERFARNYG